MLSLSSVSLIHWHIPSRALQGLDREVYCAGWIIVGHLLDQGRKFSELASIPQANAINLVAQQIKELK
jgi:hypothetical protein